jgi:hypothetical protein
VLGNRVEERRDLQPVAAGPAAGLLDDPAGVDGVLDRGHDQPGADLRGAPVPELQDLGEVVAGVHVHDRERDVGRRERALRQGQHDDRVLATGEEQRGALELGGDLSHDVDRFRFQDVKLREQVVTTRRCHQQSSGSVVRRCRRR